MGTASGGRTGRSSGSLAVGKEMLMQSEETEMYDIGKVKEARTKAEEVVRVLNYAVESDEDSDEELTKIWILCARGVNLKLAEVLKEAFQQ